MSCRKCKNEVKSQVVRLAGVGYFSVKKAIKLLQDKPRASRKLTRKELTIVIGNSKIKRDDEHIKHVDISVPGIVGRTDKETFMLDGNHRCQKAHKLKKSFHVFELTEFETGQVFQKDLPKGKIFK